MIHTSMRFRQRRERRYTTCCCPLSKNISFPYFGRLDISDRVSSAHLQRSITGRRGSRSQHRMDVMLRQLRAGTNFVRLQEDIVCYGKCTVDPRYLEAIDVMLELSGCDPSFFSSERLESPFLLRFTGSGEELSYLFTVAWLDTPERIRATSRMKGERIIWISDRRDSRGIALPHHHIFAVCQEDGTHRFFGSHEPEKI